MGIPNSTLAKPNFFKLEASTEYAVSTLQYDQERNPSNFALVQTDGYVRLFRVEIGDSKLLNILSHQEPM